MFLLFTEMPYPFQFPHDLLSSAPYESDLHSCVLWSVKRHFWIIFISSPFTFFLDPSFSCQKIWTEQNNTFSLSFALLKPPYYTCPHFFFQLLFIIFECCRDLDQIETKSGISSLYHCLQNMCNLNFWREEEPSQGHFKNPNKLKVALL